MELSRVMDKLKPGENVAPDLSSYDAMVAKYRGSPPIPTQKEINDKWAEIAANDALVAYKTLQKEAIAQAKVTTEDKLNALWQLAKGDSTEFDRINAIVEKAETDFPKPLTQ